MNKKGKLIWITGLSGAGKSTIGLMVHKLLREKIDNVVLIDGDVIREILGNDLGHCIEDRKKNAFRISKMCQFLVDQNINVVCSTMSLFKEIHEFNRENIDNYFDVFLDVDIDTLIKRDSKSIYSRAKSGELKNIIGIDLPYDRPIDPFMIIENKNFAVSIEDKASMILTKIGF